MQGRSAVRLLTLAVSIAAISCAPATVESPAGDRLPNNPAEISVPRDANGKIEVAALFTALAPFRGATAHGEQRDCQQPASGCPLRLEVEEIGKSNDVIPSKPTKFRIIGQWTNTSATNKEARYGLKPSTVYFVWVGPAPAPSATLKSQTYWGLIEVGGDITTLGYVIKCDEHIHLFPRSSLSFKTCGASPTASAAAPSGVQEASMFSLVTFSGANSSKKTYSTSEGWFECDPGCCTGTTSFAK